MCSRCEAGGEDADSLTCHPGPRWLDMEPAAAPPEAAHRQRLMIPLFKLPDTQNPQLLGEDVCEEMEILVFGSEQGSWNTRRRRGEHAIEQYRRWVRFVVQSEGARLWVCCQLAEGSTPFVK